MLSLTTGAESSQTLRKITSSVSLCSLALARQDGPLLNASASWHLCSPLFQEVWTSSGGTCCLACHRRLIWLLRPRRYFPTLLIVLLAVFNDGAMIALSKDRVTASRTPNRWDLTAIFVQGARSALGARAGSAVAL